MDNLKVIFRKEAEDSILAVFPELPGTNEFDVAEYQARVAAMKRV